MAEWRLAGRRRPGARLLRIPPAAEAGQARHQRVARSIARRRTLL